MIHTKLLIRRLAYVPWLLSVWFGAGMGRGSAGAAAPILQLYSTVDNEFGTRGVLVRPRSR